jgi:hypothetical protein
MTVKRVILIVLTVFAIARIALSLVESFGQPQIQSRLELYQTNLLLHAAEWQEGESEDAVDLSGAREAIIGTDPFQTAAKQYQEALDTAQTTRSQILAKLGETASEDVATPDLELAQPQEQFAPVADPPGSSEKQLQQSFTQVEQLIDELNLRLGLIQVEQGETDAALETWNQLSNQEAVEPTAVDTTPDAKTAQVLIGMWNEPPRLLPDAESRLQNNLESWFRYRALTQLYQLQQRQEALQTLQAQEQEAAQQAIFKLALIGGIPGLGGLIGVVLLLFLGAQWLFQGKQSVLATNSGVRWETPWNWEIIWQVLIFGFFFIGQIALPLLFGILGLNPAEFGVRMKAFYVLLSYFLMASGGLLVLYFSIKSYLPVSNDWFRLKFRDNWILWGFGGYLVALPLVILVSLINQQIWQGQGGSNPILPLALEGQDVVALAIFFVTASIAAPLFEEAIFRGFLLPSLTRYVPVWGAILASALLFAVAHLSLSEVLPLFTLGIILGVVYTRSRNLLAPMLLHSLWNSGTLVSLFILGSGTN